MASMLGPKVSGETLFSIALGSSLSNFSNIEELIKGGERGQVGEIRVRPNGKKYQKNQCHFIRGVGGIIKICLLSEA